MKILTDELKGRIEDFLQVLVKRIQAEMMSQNVNASGRLFNSISYEITDESDGTHAKVYASKYFPYTEGGRTEGKIPKNFGEILAQWVKDKRIAIPSGFKSEMDFGWAIASKIKKYGSKRYREHTPVDLIGPALDKELPLLNKEIQNRIVFYINDSVFDL